MKKINIAYWIFTILLCALMGIGAIPNLLSSADSVAAFKHLGYPIYLLPFLGLAKLLGIIAVLVPGFPRLKEWAYAGLFFDLTGAIYSTIAIGDPVVMWLPTIILGYGILFGSYIFYHKKRTALAVA